MQKVKPKLKYVPIKRTLPPRKYETLKKHNSAKVIAAVDEALECYDSQMLSVGRDTHGLLFVRVETEHYGGIVKAGIACYGLCNLSFLYDGLIKRHVACCF